MGCGIGTGPGAWAIVTTLGAHALTVFVVTVRRVRFTLRADAPGLMTRPRIFLVGAFLT